ncbi:MAG: DUF72 domain-containing protein [Patescibacteria group bacterium]|nr:DUF72 domain-containing protein [Patescibacteria group bacterium]
MLKLRSPNCFDNWESNSKIIKVGCCGFPLNKKEYYKKFSIVELQSTFYDPPAKLETVEKWRKEAPKDFEFVIKAWMVITHEISSPTYKRLKKKFGNPKNYGFFKSTKEVFEAWEKTKEVAKALKSKIIVFQCPASFKPEKENVENLRRFFKKAKDKDLIYVWEPRGEWDLKIIKELSQGLNLVHCVDPFKQKSVYGKINYFRLHGQPGYNLRYKYTEEDLKQLLKFCDRKINYVMFNNLSMVQDAQKFQKLIK